MAPELVTYLSVAPSESDHVDRKYKLPLLAVEVVETETICIMNALLKLTPEASNYFLAMFDMLKGGDVLPLLAGYFNRVNFTLCRTRYKEALESIYSSSVYLELLVSHSYLESLANCLPLYLCVETSKNIILSEEKTAIKMGIVRSIMTRL